MKDLKISNTFTLWTGDVLLNVYDKWVYPFSKHIDAFT